MIPIILFYNNNDEGKSEKKSIIELSDLPISYEGKVFYQSCINIFRYNDLIELIKLNLQDFLRYELLLLIFSRYLPKQINTNVFNELLSSINYYTDQINLIQRLYMENQVQTDYVLKNDLDENEQIKTNILFISKGFCDFVPLTTIQIERFIESNSLIKMLIQNGVEFDSNSPFMGFIGANNTKKEDWESEELPIIAFCTDIKGSVNGIETDGEKAFNQYCSYIDNVAHFYIKQLELSEEKFFQSNLWVPGDALWGLANSKNGESLKDNIIVIFSRIISSIAYSLALTNIWSKEQKISPLKIRAAAFHGKIFRKLLINNYFLHNGRCLNACGRIQGKAEPNSMFLGFIFSQNNDTTKQNLDFLKIELPEIEYGSIHKQINKILPHQVEKCGCRIKFHTVKTEENKLLLHFATYPTKELKGLEDTIIITTKVEFQVDEANKIFGIEHQEEGSSYRQEYILNFFDEIDLADLINLTIDNKLGYLKEIYSKDNNIIIKYNNATKNFILEFERGAYCPRVNEGGELIKKSIIDFSKDKYCILPVYKSNKTMAIDKAILIFTENMDNEKAIIFTEIPDSEICNIKNYNYYYDLANLCIKFKIM